LYFNSIRHKPVAVTPAESGGGANGNRLDPTWQVQVNLSQLSQVDSQVCCSTIHKTLSESWIPLLHLPLVISLLMWLDQVNLDVLHHVSFSKPGTSLVAWCCTFSNRFMSFFKWGLHVWTQYSKWGLIKDLYKVNHVTRSKCEWSFNHAKNSITCLNYLSSLFRHFKVILNKYTLISFNRYTI